MIIYAVHIDVHREVEDDYRAWLKRHVRHMLALPGFERVEIYEREEDGHDDMAKWSVLYYVESRRALENYFREYAIAMRDDGTNRFGDYFTVSRQILIPNAGMPPLDRVTRDDT